METGFTKRKAAATFLGAAVGILVLNILQFTGQLGWWQIMLTFVGAIELGCFVGAPQATKQVHLAVWNEQSLRWMLRAFALGILFYAHYIFYLVADAAGTYAIEYFGRFQFLHKISPFYQKGITEQVLPLLVILAIIMFVGVIFYSAMVESDWAPKFLRSVRQWHEWTFLAVFFQAGLLLVAGPIVLFFMMTFLVWMGLTMALGIFVMTVLILNLAGKHQTAAIVFGVAIGIGVGAALGWTQMVFWPTVTVMSIGSVAGALSGYILSVLGVAFNRWDDEVTKRSAQAA